MNRKKFSLPLIGTLFVLSMTLAKCGGGSSSGAAKDSTTTNVNAPAPDNNSATNPSSADTAFQKDSTHHKKDSMR